jgi:hypothetical protein
MKHASRRQSGHRSGPVIIAFDGSPAGPRALQGSAQLWRRGPGWSSWSGKRAVADALRWAARTEPGSVLGQRGGGLT